MKQDLVLLLIVATLIQKPGEWSEVWLFQTLVGKTVDYFLLFSVKTRWTAAPNHSPRLSHTFLFAPPHSSSQCQKTAACACALGPDDGHES